MQLLGKGSVIGSMHLPPWLRLLNSISIGVWFAFATGCNSDSHSENRVGPSAVVTDYPPSMAGVENFADGKLAIQVTLGLGSAFRPDQDSEHPGGGSHGSGRRGRGHRNGGGPGAGPPPAEAEDGGRSSSTDSPSSHITGSTLPSAQFKLHLQNTSTTESITCEVEDFNSALGNFAVFPGRYELKPGESASSETMTSRLGVEGDGIPVTVAVRVHDHLEKKVITLHLLPIPAKSPATESGK